MRPAIFLLLRSETKGLGAQFLQGREAATYCIPIFEPGVRSLNLSNAVSVVLHEALHHVGTLD